VVLEWNGASWAARPQTGQVPSQPLAAAWDPADDWSLVYTPAGLERWSAAGWSAVSGAPAGLAPSQLAWDRVSGQLILVGVRGSNTQITLQTWAWNRSQWTLVASRSVAVPVPPAPSTLPAPASPPSATATSVPPVPAPSGTCQNLNPGSHPGLGPAIACPLLTPPPG